MTNDIRSTVVATDVRTTVATAAAPTVDPTEKGRWQAPFSAPDMTYDEACSVAHDRGFFGKVTDPLLETVVDMLDELGRPDSAFDVVQVAGTNGKTSTCRYTASILSGEGLSCALYTSPELVEMRERMEVGGRPVSRDAFARGVSLAAEAGRRVNARRVDAGQPPYHVTEFDLLTVAACCVFAEAHVDVAVLEVGLGGRWDATTATHPRVTCVTGIGLDHTRILGDTLEAIAAEKGGVIKPGQACVLGVGTATPDTMEDVLLDRCREQGVVPTLLRPLDAADAPGEMHPGTPRVHDDLPRASYRITHRPSRVGDTLIMDVTTPRATYDGVGALKPAYQAANIACAICVAEAYLDRVLDPQRLMDSLVVCPTPGRFDVLSGDPLVLVDACHNPQSVDAFLSAVRAAEPDIMARPQLLCAVLADKDVEGIVERLARCFPSVSVTQTSSPRAISAEELGRMFAACDRPPHHVFPTVADAVSGLAGESFVACGSITLAGEVCGIMRGPSR